MCVCVYISLFPTHISQTSHRSKTNVSIEAICDGIKFKKKIKKFDHFTRLGNAHKHKQEWEGIIGNLQQSNTCMIFIDFYCIFSLHTQFRIFFLLFFFIIIMCFFFLFIVVTCHIYCIWSCLQFLVLFSPQQVTYCNNHLISTIILY